MTATIRLVRWLDLGLRIVRVTARIAAIIGGAALLICALLITADVILRRVFGLSTWGASELSYYVLAISSSWAFAHALLVKAHIRIDMMTMHLSGPLRSASNVIALLAMGFLALMACGSILEEVERVWTRGTTSITRLALPLWIPEGLWFLGFVFFLLTIILLLLRVTVALVIEGDHEIVEDLVGTPTAEDEIADSTEGAI